MPMNPVFEPEFRSLGFLRFQGHAEFECQGRLTLIRLRQVCRPERHGTGLGRLSVLCGMTLRGRAAQFLLERASHLFCSCIDTTRAHADSYSP